MRDGFDTYHPTVSFGYFCAIIVCSVFFTVPVCIAASFAGAFVYAVYLKKTAALKFFLIAALPVMLISVVINIFFNHHGVTVLFYIGGNPVTREVVCYASAAAVMFAGIIMWFYCAGSIITDDKIVYIFGRIMPVISLMFSMILRFLPRFTAQAKKVYAAQKGMNLAGEGADFKHKFMSGTRTVSIMVSWALENSVETAASMRARGYGLPGRTSWHLFRFDKRDCIFTAVLICMFAVIVTGAFFKYNTMYYYPVMEFPKPERGSVIEYSVYIMFCFMPVLLNVREEVKWRSLK